MEIFGFSIKRKSEKKPDIENISTKVSADVDDGSTIISTGVGGHFGHYIDISGDSINNEKELILKYRLIAEQPECDSAINDIINESISFLEDGYPVSLNMDSLEISDKLKDDIRKEFKTVLNLLNFSYAGPEIFRRWYIDGRLFYNIVIDKSDPKKGILELNQIDSTKIRKVKEVEKKQGPGGELISDTKEDYFLYSENSNKNNTEKGLKFSKDSICYVPSGIVDAQRKTVLSYLHKAIKPVNQLRMMEDSLVIYRLSRAPERRIFYIDVGNLPRGKANEYLHSIMNKYRNKLTYDADTGEIREDKKHMTMMDDFWLPRRDGGRGTEITTLPGGCFAMDTKVSLLDGRDLSIREIEKEMKNGKELWTYSCHPTTGKIVPGLISWAGVTQKSAKVMKLTLDNGETITCTPDHKFPLYERGFVRADELKVGESLIPLYKKNEKIRNKGNEYEQVFDNDEKEWIYTHRLVANYLKDSVVNYEIFDENTSSGAFDCVHHKNFDRFNNSPSNLCWMDSKDHWKLHSTKGFTYEESLDASKKAAEKLAWLKENDPKAYKDILNRQKESRKRWYDSLSEKEYKQYCKNISKGISNYIKNLNSVARKKRDEISKKNFKKGSEKLQELLKDKDYKTEFYNKVSSSWTEENKELARKRVLELNKKLWSNEKHRKNHTDKQKIEYSRNFLNFVISVINGKTTHQFTLENVVDSLNSNKEIMDEFRELNKDKSTPNFIVENGFTKNLVIKMVKSFGFESWKQFRDNACFNNHKVVKIEYLNDPIEVGTLTIDQEEKHHDYHTFALSVGVFTKNSSLGDIEDIVYFQKRLYKSLNVPINRLESETQFSLGRPSEMNREEIKFQKFIDRLRKRFSQLFLDLLKVQLELKNLVNAENWSKISNNLSVDYITSSYFSELKQIEIMNERLRMAQDVDQLIGKYYSNQWVRRNILMQTDEQIEQMDKEIKDEKEDPRWKEDDMGGFR